MGLEKLFASTTKKPSQVAKEIVKQEPIAVNLTIEYFTKAVNEDYFDKIKDVPELAPYIKAKGITSMNLYNRGYRLKLNKCRCTLGRATYQTKEINLSLDYINGANQWLGGLMESVVLHELSHAITFEIFGSILWQENNSIDPLNVSTEGHGIMFKAVCNAINPEGDCSRFAHNVEKGNEFKLYVAVCPKCGKKNYGDEPGTTQCSVCKTFIKYRKN